MVGPGFSPVPAKLVSRCWEFVELHQLLPSNIVLNEPEPQLLFDGRLVLTSPLKKPKRRIGDISTLCSELLAPLGSLAFSVPQSSLSQV